jgi:hypothetical protein
LSLKTKINGLWVVWPQNHSNGFSLVRVSKLVATVSSSLASKPVAMVFDGLTSKPGTTVYDGLTSKPVATVSPQNLLWRFPGLGLKIGDCGLVI